jgi:2-C-methyl-D-erythritol 4-phosphate cytidylyltransferase
MMSAIALVPMADPAESVLGMSMFERAVRTLLQAGCVRHVFFCTPVNAPAATPVQESTTTFVRGTVADALILARRMMPDVPYALVHEPTRAATPPEVVKAVVAALEQGAPAVIPVLPLTDTVKRVDGHGRITGTRDRAGLRVMQSPLGARVDVLAAANGPLPAGLGVPLTTVPGDPRGLRIRTALDVATVTG